MKWIRPEGEKYYEHSECLRYRVCAFKTAEGWLYEAWDGKKMLATRLPSAKAAKAVAQLEAEKMNSNSIVEGSHRADETHSVVICDGVAR